MANTRSFDGHQPTPPNLRDPQPTPQGPQRAQAPIRWPHPDRSNLLAVALWAIGLVIALAVPAAIVPPGQKTAHIVPVWTAFSFTVIGAALMIGSTTLRWRRTGDSGLLILGVVPGLTVIIGGIILATTKIFGGA